jgi:hypothetical protein
LPPQRPNPNPGNGRPREAVKENYRAVVARAAWSSALLVWVEPHLFGQPPGVSELINGCSPSMATRSRVCHCSDVGRSIGVATAAHCGHNASI